MKKHLLLTIVFLQSIVIFGQVTSKEADYAITYNGRDIQLQFDHTIYAISATGSHHQEETLEKNSNNGNIYTLKNTQPGSIIQLDYQTFDGVRTVAKTTYLATASQSTGTMDVYFNHPVDVSYSQGHDAVNLGDTLDDKLITYINACTTTLDMAIYNSSSSSATTGIAGAINNAFARGVQVRVIYDGSTSSDMIPLLNPLIPRLASPTTSSYGIMHNKFVIFDANDADANKPVVWTGSTNWTVAQIDGPDKNSVIVIQDQSLALGYKIEFEEMWGSSTNTRNIANSRFGPYKIDNTPHTYNIGGKIVNCYFSPSDGTTSKIIDAINSANTDIDIALMVITRSDISSALNTKYNGGLKPINIIMDTQNPLGNQKTVLQQTLGVNQVRTDVLSGIMHHKFMVVDNYNSSSDPLVLLGSHNWSSAADSKNDENTLIVHDLTIANQYYQAWAYLFKSTGGVISSPLGVSEDLYSTNSYVVYPNPSNGVFTIKNKKSLVGRSVISVYDLTGKLVYSKTVPEFNTQIIDLSVQPNGMYIINIANASGISHIKVIKQ